MHYLKALENEAIYILREAIAEGENPVLLYSIGKDSQVLLHLLKKAVRPNKVYVPLLHIDTTWKFKEMIAFRDKIVKENQLDLITHTNQEGLQQNITPLNTDSDEYTMVMKTTALKQALDKYHFDMIIAGARRDEEVSRAKERIFSLRNQAHHWDPKNQRPEFWNNFNTLSKKDESFRVFPLSNWSELDIWQYIKQESIDIVPLYFAKDRPVTHFNNAFVMVDDERLPITDKVVNKQVRFRSLGCYPLSAVIESTADTLDKVIDELKSIKRSERDGRLIDHSTKSTMEKKKQEGYF